MIDAVRNSIETFESTGLTIHSPTLRELGGTFFNVKFVEV